MTLTQVLQQLRPSPSSYLSSARQIESEFADELLNVNVAFISTYTLDLIKPYLVVEGAAKGLSVNPYFAPFNQLEQQAMDPSSGLYACEPHITVLAARLEELAPKIYERFTTHSSKVITDELTQLETRLSNLVGSLRKFSSSTILMFNFSANPILAAGLADSSLESSQVSVVSRANEMIARICRDDGNAYVFDYAGLVNLHGSQHWQDLKLWYLAHMPFGTNGQIATAKLLARYLHSIKTAPLKCLVLDADDTLWGGILGEEGIGGIDLGEEYPGSVYKEFHRTILALRDRGVLLAIASKNNREDVLEVLQTHSDCLLKVEDFAALQIHWEDKASSLIEIAKELNISTDSLAFFDDNPVERDWVRTQLPEVKVIEVPTSPLEYPIALEQSGAFDHLTVSTEDRMRTDMYQGELQRNKIKSQSLSLEDFLEKLEMTATIGHVGPETLSRVAQLMGKTNQFNLTTRRHSSSNITALIHSGAEALWLRVIDRFGDNGIVAVAISFPSDSTAENTRWNIDTFLMSCRVFGRRVETALLSTLAHNISKRGGETLIGEYIPTSKNKLVSDFYPSHGFQRVVGKQDLWELDLTKNVVPLPEFVNIEIVHDTGFSR